MSKLKRRVYFGLWGNQDEMLDEFNQPPGVLFGRRVLIAKADGPESFRLAWVVLEDRQGRLFLVQDDQSTSPGYGEFAHWNPKDVTAEDLRFAWVAWDEEPSRNPDFALDTEFMEALDALLRERE